MPEWAILRNWKVKNRKYPNKDNFKKRNLILRQFLAYFATLTGKHPKLEALKQIAEMDFPVSAKPIKKRMQVKREKFNKHKHWKLDLEGNCVVCGARADVRHHIIQIQKGGTNGHHNLVLLCNPCHAEVHPWLKQRLQVKPSPLSAQRSNEASGVIR